jgi:hypothetical protein
MCFDEASLKFTATMRCLTSLARTKGDVDGPAEKEIKAGYPEGLSGKAVRRQATSTRRCIEHGERFRIQVAGERVSVPPDARINLEHERGTSEEEIEFQLKWRLDG